MHQQKVPICNSGFGEPAPFEALTRLKSTPSLRRIAVRAEVKSLPADFLVQAVNTHLPIRTCVWALTRFQKKGAKAMTHKLRFSYPSRSSRRVNLALEGPARSKSFITSCPSLFILD